MDHADFSAGSQIGKIGKIGQELFIRSEIRENAFPHQTSHRTSGYHSTFRLDKLLFNFVTLSKVRREESNTTRLINESPVFRNRNFSHHRAGTPGCFND